MRHLTKLFDVPYTRVSSPIWLKPFFLFLTPPMRPCSSATPLNHFKSLSLKCSLHHLVNALHLSRLRPRTTWSEPPSLAPTTKPSLLWTSQPLKQPPMTLQFHVSIDHPQAPHGPEHLEDAGLTYRPSACPSHHDPMAQWQSVGWIPEPICARTWNGEGHEIIH